MQQRLLHRDVFARDVFASQRACIHLHAGVHCCGLTLIVTMPGTQNTLVGQLVEYLRGEGVEIKGARGIDGMEVPPLVTNDGFGSSRPRRPDVIGFDPGKRRIVFGLVVPDREHLDSEDALEAYNVFLDHNAGAGDRASALYVILPQELLNEFTSLVTHYIHREYWHRVVGVAATAGSQSP